MSFVIGLCVILGFVVGAFAYLLFRQRAWIPLTAGIIVFFGCLTWFLTPVCVAILEEDLATFKPPINMRTETGLLGQRYFQKRDEGWFQCKARIARQLFF